MPLTIQLDSSKRQTAFNLNRWVELLKDPDLIRLPHRIESDRHGHILMSPAPAPSHGNQQSEIGFFLRTFLARGIVVTECPLSTSDGVKAIDVAWLASERRQEVHSESCLVRAPEICAEVLSPSNTPDEISEKIALYFEAGAREVWICEKGALQFYVSTASDVRRSSEMCPEFPPGING